MVKMCLKTIEKLLPKFEKSTIWIELIYLQNHLTNSLLLTFISVGFIILGQFIGIYFP